MTQIQWVVATLCGLSLGSSLLSLYFAKRSVRHSNDAVQWSQVAIDASAKLQELHRNRAQ